MSKQQIQALVTAYFGNSVTVADQSGQTFSCHLLRNQDCPAVGDYVVCECDLDAQSQGVITSILPRRSVLTKGIDANKILAANLDIMLLAQAPPPVFSLHLLDRYLIAAELANVQAVIVINKSDLLTPEVQADLEFMLAPYAAIDYPILYTSIVKPDTILALGDFLKQQTAVLVGPSGVGKSSLIAALSNNAQIKIGDVSNKGAGKHTTTGTRLYQLPNGGKLIDSPGVREFTLEKVNAEQLAYGFKEFRPYLSGCKFRNCVHRTEPHCLVREAVAANKISTPRHERYQQLLLAMVK